MGDKEQLIKEEEERFAEECRKHKERIAEIQFYFNAVLNLYSIETNWNEEKIYATVDDEEDKGFYIYTASCFKNEEFAQEYSAHISLYLRMSKWADENNGEFSGNKYSLWVDNDKEKITWSSVGNYVTEPMTPYFSSEEIVKKAREKFGDEMLKIYGGQK